MADYTGTGAEGDFYSNPNPARNREIQTEQDKLPIEMTRENPHYSARKWQMNTNIMAVEGGRPYVDARLTRYAGESKIDWVGGTRSDGSRVTGRLQQSHSFPYPRRISDKLNQYVFNQEPARDGIDESFKLDASADGSSINDLMIQANDFRTSCGWCWIGVDMPDIGDAPISQADVRSQKIRPYWSIYSPLEVKDWKFDAIGNLLWLITEGMEYESTIPTVQPQTVKVRRIWTKGAVQVIKSVKNKEGKWEIRSREDKVRAYQPIPFVLVGETFSGGYAFDDIESINRSIMDLESVNRANFFRSSYPQMVLPESVLQNVADSYGTDVAGASELVFGMNYPILVSEGDISPFYLMPDASALKAPREEIQSLKKNMFDSVGLMLQNDSKQVASAESKAWDFLDVAQVMKARAQILEDAETRAAKITNEMDRSIPLWTPVYNRDFDIGDFEQEISALIMTVNAPMPVEMSRLILEKIVNRLDRIGSGMSDEQREVVLDAIKNFDPNAFGIAPMEGDDET